MKFKAKKFVILIPAYKPVYDQMIPFVKELLETYNRIVVVDDGGGADYKNVFEECDRLGCTVLTHEVNKGKGAALKTGIKYIYENMKDSGGVITADCDGQHAVSDIFKVSRALYKYPDYMIIGGRRFDKNVPFRSKAGNTFTRLAYKLATGIFIYDTQTGLRGFPFSLLPKLAELEGDRYEYEMNMLLKLREWGVKPYEITIETIYINENKGSHFNALKDGLKIGARVLKYAVGSILSFLIDYLVFILLMKLVFPAMDETLRYALSFGIARVVSSTVNFLYNRSAVFGKNHKKGALIKYFGLVIAVMLLGMAVQSLTSYVPGGDIVHVIIKVAYDATMFFVNYLIQRDIVFKTKDSDTETEE